VNKQRGYSDDYERRGGENMFAFITRQYGIVLCFLFLVQQFSFCETTENPTQIGNQLEKIATESPDSGSGSGLDVVFRVDNEVVLEIIIEKIKQEAQNSHDLDINNYKTIIEANGGYMTGYYVDDFNFKKSSSGFTRESKISTTDISNFDYVMSSEGIVPVDKNIRVEFSTKRQQIYDGEATYDIFLDMNQVSIHNGNAINSSISDKSPFLGDQRQSNIIYQLQKNGPSNGFEQGIGEELEFSWFKDNVEIILLLQNFEQYIVPSSIKQISYSPERKSEIKYYDYRLISGFPFPLISLKKTYSYLPDGSIDNIRCSLQITPKFSFEEVNQELFVPSLKSGYKVIDYRSGGNEPEFYEIN
jgi:hypothetical protein